MPILWEIRGTLRFPCPSTTLLPLLCLAASCGGAVQPASTALAEANAPSESVARDAMFPDELASFDYVWSTIERTHWEPEKVGASWKDSRTKLRPKVIAATTKAEARAVLKELIASLGQSHFEISGIAQEASTMGGAGSLGIDVRMIDEQVVVWRVHAGGPAALQGIKTGMVIEAVNENVWIEVLPKLRKAGLTPGGYREGAQVTSFVHGDVGAEATLRLLDGKGRTSEVKLRWTKAPGTIASFGVIKNIPVEYDSYDIDKSTGYIRLSVFFDPVMVNRRFKADIKRFSGKSGLVFDLRGNPGGLGGMAMGLGGHLMSEKGSKLGSMISKDSRLDFVLNPQPGAFTGKLAILVDGQCVSTCEIIAAGLEDIGRAQVFGTRTAGAALPSQIEKLPNGALFQYATANYISISGRTLEKDGLTPKTIVPLTRESLLAGSDSQLAAAVAWLHKN